MFLRARMNPIVLAELGALLIGTFVLMVSGLYYGEWWGGFGLILFMTALIANIGFLYGPSEDLPIEPTQTEKVEQEAFFPNGAIAFFVGLILFFGSVWLALYAVLINRNGNV